MKLAIYSSFGELECIPMTLQAIEKSIPSNREETEQNQAELRKVAVDSPSTDF